MNVLYCYQRGAYDLAAAEDLNHRGYHICTALEFDEAMKAINKGDIASVTSGLRMAPGSTVDPEIQEIFDTKDSDRYE
jgi:hypothetical protein